MKIKAANVGKCDGVWSQRGDVLMEYVLLMAFVVIPLVTVSPILFNPAGDYKDEFGLVGTSFHDFYSNLVTHISMPIP